MRRAARTIGLAAALALPGAAGACIGYSHPSVDEPELDDDPADEPAPDPARWDADMAVAERVVARIIDLRRRHPRLRGLSVEAVTRWENGRGLDLTFARGVHYRDDPDCRPGLKCSRLEDFDHDGVEIHVYLSLDPWQGAAAVLPRRIGALHVVTFIDGPDNAAMDRLRSDIETILADAGG